MRLKYISMVLVKNDVLYIVKQATQLAPCSHDTLKEDLAQLSQLKFNINAQLRAVVNIL